MIKNILCVCKGNTCRSPMLEVLLQATLKEKELDVQVKSAGVLQEAVGRPANEHSVTCMDNRGLDLKKHRSHWIGDLNLSRLDLIICMSQEVAEKLKEFGVSKSTKVIVANEEQGGVPNPWQKGFSVYQDCAKILEQVAKDLVKRYF